MNKTFFSSDLHGSHRNILLHQPNRTLLYKTMEEHDNALIKNWNSVVGQNDTVWLLGDIALCGFERLNQFVWLLNGKIHVCLGNHDKPKHLTKTNRFESIQDVKYTTIQDQNIFMSHYAHRVWPKSHRGSIMLYGHSHGSLLDDPNALSIDVGVDCHNMFPISFEQVMEIMRTKTYKPVDKHGEERN